MICEYTKSKYKTKRVLELNIGEIGFLMDGTKIRRDMWCWRVKKGRLFLYEYGGAYEPAKGSMRYVWLRQWCKVPLRKQPKRKKK